MDETCVKAAVYSCAFLLAHAPWLFENKAGELFLAQFAIMSPRKGSGSYALTMTSMFL